MPWRRCAKWCRQIAQIWLSKIEKSGPVIHGFREPKDSTLRAVQGTEPQ